MIKLIVGGAFQGKTAYAVKTFGLKEEEILDGEICPIEECLRGECIRNFHKLIRRICAEGGDPLAFAHRITEENQNLVVIADEIGGGIIPLDREERIWREWAGRVNCYLAEHADLVVRINCGLPMILKDVSAGMH